MGGDLVIEGAVQQ